jgi:folate-dependent phosphoribosylglycinamide formyltransferase PurN
MPTKNIVLLAGEWETTPVVYNFIKKNFEIEAAVIEQPVPRKNFLKKRIKKLGLKTVVGQVLFQLLIGKPLAKTSKRRISEILKTNKLSETPIPEIKTIKVPSVNSDECIQQLKDLSPDLIVVHGTRIISKKVLQSIQSKFINIHAGITPRYRGSHGAYWALANGDEDNCGVTVHLIDPGIDTGSILAQEKIERKEEDNFTTYPYLQLAEGLRLLKKAIEEIQSEEKPFIINNLDSRLWHHPTLWGYLWKRLTKGIK